MKIGFFDSGIGGITVLHAALQRLPKEDYIYYADTLHVPYGSKAKEEVKKYIFNAVDFIIAQGVKAVVIACNTATSVAIEDLRATYRIPIIGMEPAVKPAIEKNKNMNKRVLVTATTLTLKEKKLQNLIAKLDGEHMVDLLSLQELVTFAENFTFDEQLVLPYLQRQLANYDLNNYEAIVLGCTHFPYYRDMFRKLLPPQVDIIDGNIGTINNLKKILEEMAAIDEGTGCISFYHSGSKVETEAELANYNLLFTRLAEIN